MKRSLVVLMLVSVVAIAVLGLVGIGLSYGQAMKEKTAIIGLGRNHMSQYSHMDTDENVPTHMNVTQHMHEDMYDACKGLHDRMSMRQHMSGLP
jgi:hypothetical protein